MHFTLLSRNASLYSTERLFDTAQRRGHTVAICDPLKFTVHIRKGAGLDFLGRPVERSDAVLARIGVSITAFGLAVVRQFEEMGIPTVNSSVAIACSRDKFRASQMLSRQGLPLPATVLVRRREEILRAIDSVGGVPVVIKLLEGTQGAGVVLARDRATAQALIELMHTAKQNILVQKFVEEASSSDIRALVVEDRVVASMRRRANNKLEFRSNIHQGGIAEPYDIDETTAGLAVAAARAFGLDIAGVDLIESNDGPLILEVNSSPGLEAIERVSGEDIASAMIACLERRASAKQGEKF